MQSYAQLSKLSRKKTFSPIKLKIFGALKRGNRKKNGKSVENLILFQNRLKAFLMTKINNCVYIYR